MKAFLNTLIFILFFQTAFSQTDARIAKGTLPIEKIEKMVMPKQDNDRLLEQELKERKPGRADHFAVPMEVFITPSTHGTWEKLMDGKSVWRVRIQSEGAKSLNLGFTKYLMPKGGKMIMYSANQQEVQGPFTPADNEEHEQLWTPIIESDDLIVEVQLPFDQKNELRLELKYINHDFIGFRQLNSGSCNLDVICGEEDGWGIVDEYRDIIQSVAFMHVNGSANCTGFLVNNTSQDCRPYFMTAYHCGVRAGDAPTLVTYWNFQNSECRQPNSAASGQSGDGQLNTFNSGSVLRAEWSDTDFTLLELDDPVVLEAEAYFAGWDATNTIPQSAIAVHHPSNCEKRISFENDPLYPGEWGDGDTNIPNGNHLIVPDWDIGTTEGGSSGSPLFNANKQVVGQLHGGAAACGNDEYDSYGWFYYSWEGGGTPQSRLKDWLDPNNTGLMSINGKNCNFFVEASQTNFEICNSINTVDLEITPSDNFINPTALSVVNLPAGMMANFENPTVNPGTSTTLTLSNFGSLAAGEYNLKIEATDGTETGDVDIIIILYDGVPALPNLNSPTDMAMGVTTMPNFSWNTDDNVASYTLELATDASFMNIVASETDIMGNTLMSPTILNAITTYYWRVMPVNECGSGAWSDVFSFTTANIQCNTVTPNDLPIEISDGGPNDIESSLEILTDGEIVDVNVNNVKGIHTYVSDLTVILISPAGTEIVLWDNKCDDLDNFDIGFDDESLNNTFPCPPTSGSIVRPQGSLSSFNGENAMGTWTLRIEDGFNLDGGSLDQWALQICIIPSNAISLSSSITTASLCTSEDELNFNLQVGGGFNNPVSISSSVNPSAPFTISYDSDETNVSPGSNIGVTISNIGGVNIDDYIFTFTANDGTNTESTTVGLLINDIPNAPLLNSPLNGATNVALEPTFSWTNVATGSGYTIEIATDNNFNSVVASEALNGTSFTTTSLQDNTQYFWQVTATNECGTAFSDVFSFTTEESNSIQTLDGTLLQLSPNPTNGLVNLKFGPSFAEELKINLMTIDGKVLNHWTIENPNDLFTIDLSNYINGIYLIRLITDKGILTKRIVLAKE